MPIPVNPTRAPKTTMKLRRTRNPVHRLHRQYRPLCFEDVYEGGRDYARRRIAGSPGNHQVGTGAAEDEDPVDTPRVKGCPRILLRCIGRELEGAWRRRREGRRDLLHSGGGPYQPDRDVVRLGVLDRGPDEADERHQDEQPSNQGGQKSCQLGHGNPSLLIQRWMNSTAVELLYQAPLGAVEAVEHVPA